MRLFLCVLLQILIFLPLTSIAAEKGLLPVLENHRTRTINKTQKSNIINSYGRLPLYFIENRGQVDGEVRFYEKGAGHGTFFTRDGVLLSLTKTNRKADKTTFNEGILGLKTKNPTNSTNEALSLTFIGANAKAAITASEKMDGHVNYFIGNDKAKWLSNVPTYGALTYKDVYKNIDIKFYGNNRRLEHDVIVRPGGDISSVSFAYNGVQGLRITKEGDLEVSLKSGKITQKKPVIYQVINGERSVVLGAYRILENSAGTFTYGFTVASYDHSKKIVIDPMLEYSTYLGGSSTDSGESIVVDNTGAAYVTGKTSSTNFPLMNPIQATGAGSSDVFITKINPAGTAIVYSTYMGGGSGDSSKDIAIDSTGAAYVTGWTWSTDYPLMNAVQAANGGLIDVFVTKINPAGSAIVYSTYLGGASRDYGNAIAVDNRGAVFVTGDSASTDFPLLNPIQAALVGGADAFITKLNPAGSAYVYSTYFGGSLSDSGRAIALDRTGAAYVTGNTRSTDFPLLNPIQGVSGGGEDAFVTKINPAGTAYLYSTYLGGLLYDMALGIAIDSTGAAYVAGTTYSLNFPLLNPIQAVNGNSGDVFITKINPAGTAYVYSTYLGGNSTDSCDGIAVDNTGAAYVTGYTDSSDFPLVAPTQGFNSSGAYDVFITKIDAAGTAIVYSTYLGGNSDDYGSDITVDNRGAAYVTGESSSTDFPLLNAVQGVSGGGKDAFVTRISGAITLPVVDLAVVPDTLSVVRGGTIGYTVQATNTTATEQCFNYWENVTLPNSSTYPPAGALLGPLYLCLNAGASKSAHLTHGVPLAVPLGTYVLNAFTGAYPIIVVSEAHFTFDVTAVGTATQNPQTSWRLIENGFRK